MKRKYWIALALCIILILGILVTGSEYKKNNDSEKTQIKTDVLLATQGNTSKKEYFYLSELNGYVVVYREDKNTIYEYTNIAISDLPEQLKSEIVDGKKINSVQELYGFLENYSS